MLLHWMAAATVKRQIEKQGQRRREERLVWRKLLHVSMLV